jgi:hypothetical protein
MEMPAAPEWFLRYRFHFNFSVKPFVVIFTPFKQLHEKSTIKGMFNSDSTEL